VFQFFNF